MSGSGFIDLLVRWRVHNGKIRVRVAVRRVRDRMERKVRKTFKRE